MVAPSRVRGLKLRMVQNVPANSTRRTLTGAWIEAEWYPYRLRDIHVAPSRVRGLKPLPVCPDFVGDHRRTLTGAWIEA